MGEKVLFKIADELEIDLQVNDIQKVHQLGQKWRNKENPRPIIARFVSYKKTNELITNKQDLKNIERRQHVFICEDLTPLRYKLLKYMQISYSDTFISCYTWNGNIKAKLKTSEKWGHRHFTWWSLQTRNWCWLWTDRLWKSTLHLTLPQRYTFREFWNKTLNASDCLHLNNKLPEAKYKRKCVNFVCWNAFSVLNIWLLAQQCKNMLPT